MKEVIIIEDESSIADLIKLHLQDIDCEVHCFVNGKDGYQFALKNPFDLLILDINLPGMNGLDICRELRANKITSPILMLTARTEEIDKVLGLETGADDYITKPFGIREFLARVKAIFRRVEIDRVEQFESIKLIEFKGLSIDRKKRKVELRGGRIELTPKEFDLLYTLATNPGVTFERKELLSKVWGYDFEGYEHTVNSHINRLRGKIEKDPNNPEYVLTTWGVGYRFADN
ncbi:MAG: response regulator transcription factor [Flavobacteriales bacterium]|nr:response regulator transcription factor [Flavobacteriales bacterium]